MVTAHKQVGGNFGRQDIFRPAFHAEINVLVILRFTDNRKEVGSIPVGSRITVRWDNSPDTAKQFPQSPGQPLIPHSAEFFKAHQFGKAAVNATV